MLGRQGIERVENKGIEVWMNELQVCLLVDIIEKLETRGGIMLT